MITYISQPLSRNQLRSYARQIRKFLGIEDDLYFPVMEVLEILPEIFPKLTWEVVSDDELPYHIHAETDIITHHIRIKESVYDGACNGKGRDRMTIVHEIAHYFILCVSGIRLQRNFSPNKVVTYCDPEWQAKCLAGELMIPAYLVKDLNVFEVEEKCGVSFEAACYQLRRIS